MLDLPFVGIEGLKSFKRCVYSNGMSQNTAASNKYNEATPDVRKIQLRNAKVEEAKITELANSRFEKLSPDIQGKLNSVHQ